ncbi:MAG: hypothetical protein V4733_12540 [Verrucomicrobiota bacterium]
MNLTTKHQRLPALRSLAPELIASLAAVDVRMATGSDQFPDLGKMIPNFQP